VSDDGLQGLIARESPLYAEAAHRRWLLSLPPFRPPRGHRLRARAEALSPHASAPPGAVLLVGEHRGAGSLFWFCPEDALEQQIPFRGEAREQVHLARRLVPRALPALVEPSALEMDPAGARRAVLGSPDPGALDGPSFGLSICLAFASRLLDEPVPADLVALARLDEAGRCRPVGHLEAKLDVLMRWALGVRTVLVERGQRDEAERVVRTLGGALEVVPVADLAGALQRTFGDVEQRLGRRWTEEPERAERAARALLSLARDGCHHLIDWGGVARAARGLAARLEGEPAWMAELAAHIAQRHRAAPEPIPLHEDWLAAQPRPFRLRLWAHVVQSAADGVDAWRDRLDAAAAQVAPEGDEHPEDLELLGALGRAHASWYAYDRAVPLLERAVAGWFRLERGHEASYAATELLRIAGADGHPALEPLIAQVAEPMLADPRAPDASRAFVTVGVGRAMVQRGRPAEALAWLRDRPLAWDRSPAHARAARERWCAVALDALDRADEADAVREALQRAHAADDGAVVVRLARLDAALARDAGRLAEVAAEARSHPLLARELARLNARFAPASDRERLALLRRHSRY
jgi:hypothetical protein